MVTGSEITLPHYLSVYDKFYMVYPGKKPKPLW
jgi:hypothetical protein